MVNKKGNTKRKESEMLSYIVMTKYLSISVLVKPQLLSAKTSAFFHAVVFKPTICPAIPGDFCVIVFLWDWRGASGAAACEASGRWRVLHVNHQMFLKRATGGGAGGRAGRNSRQSGLITTGAWMPSGALGADSRSGTHLDSETVPGKK